MVKAVTPIPFVKARFFDRCGKPLAGGKVHTYAANTTTQKVTYKDPYGITPNTNPIILDAAGEADIYLDGTYRIRVTDRNDILINDVAKIGSWFSDNLQDSLDNISLAMGDAIKPKLQNLDDVINVAYAAGAGENGWTDALIALQNGRTQRDKNSELPSVKDFGAKGDGSVDDSDAFLNSPNGAKVPKGTYKITKDIGNKWFNLDDSVVITGKSAETVLTKEQYRSVNRNFFLATFFDATNFYNRPLGFYTSSDGFQFSHIGEFNNINWQSTSVADPDWIYINGYFYICATEYTKNDHDMRVYKSPDLLSWTYKDIKFGAGISGTSAPGWSYIDPNVTMLWAGQWFQDTDDKLYIIISIESKPLSPTVEGNQPYFRTYISECTDLDDLIFSAPVELTINGKKGPNQATDKDNQIDAAMYKLPNGTYILALKNEYAKKIETYSSATLLGDYKQLNADVFSPLGAVYMEGPCITLYNDGEKDLYLLYADDYYSNNVYVCTTQDFITFSGYRTIEQNSFARHGSVKNIGRLPAAQFKEIKDKVALASVFLHKPARNDIYAHKRFQELDGYPNLKNFKPENATMYVAYGDIPTDEVVISGIANNTNYVDGYYFYLALFSSNSYLNGVPKRIRISEGILKASQKLIWISPANQNADTLIKVVRDHGEWAIQNLGSQITNSNLYEIKDIMNYRNGINKDTINWYPASGGVYYTTGADDYASPVTIYDLPDSYNEGSTFYLQIRSGIDNGKIILKSSIRTWWNTDITIDKTDDSKLVGFRFVAGRWALLK